MRNLPTNITLFMQNKYQISNTKNVPNIYIQIQIIFDILKSLSIKLTHTKSYSTNITSLTLSLTSLIIFFQDM